ncbi:hypothetical protein [Parasitella parasitica]|uniref:Uncharacterized protein n=1 Tax=Parasitella parasitica TaxID=35722 RepID=A0A0B7NBI4_9FUNG|nr:hypothetical protein [Parasitella parasitica]
MMKTKPDAKQKDKAAKLPRECFYKNKRRRVYDPRDLGGMKYCYCDYPFEPNPNAGLLEFPKTPGKRCHYIAVNRRYRAAMKRAEKLKASEQNSHLHQMLQLSEHTWLMMMKPPLFTAVRMKPLLIDNGFDINDNIDYLSNQKMKKKAFVAREAWNSYRDVLRKLYFKATIAGPKSCVETTIGSGCASDELCSAECVPYLTHKAVRVFFQHGIAYFRYVQNKIC